MSGLTILRTVGSARATKQWAWTASKSEWSKISYTAGAWFTASQVPVNSLAELAKALEQIQQDARAFIVRGAFTADAAAAIAANPEHRIRRRKLQKKNVIPTLTEAPCQWLMVDIDEWPLPSWGDLADDPETAIDAAIYELLPEPFHNAECWWQLSASAGFVPDVLKIHLFFWLSEPVSNEHLKAVFKQSAPAVDRSPFNAAQPHFIAAPIIRNGHDPLPRRTGWRQGLEQHVILPELRPEAPRPRPSSGKGGHIGYLADALAVLGDGTGLEGFHAPLRTAIMRYARDCGRGRCRDDETLKAELRAAIRAAPRRKDRDPEDPYCTDYYLDGSIAGAFNLLASGDEIRTMAPEHKAPTGDAVRARRELAGHIRKCFDDTLTWLALDEPTRAEQPAQHSALVVDVGIGKSTTAREALPDFIVRAKEAGLPHRVAWMIPTLKLGDETLGRMKALGLNVAVQRGRDAADPNTGTEEIIDEETGEIFPGEPRQRMCLNPPAVEDAVAAGYDVETAACGSGKPGNPVCPFRDQCGYQRQKQTVAAADVVILSHQGLFQQLPQTVTKKLAMIVLDESWWRSGIRTNVETMLATFGETVVRYPVLTAEKIIKGRFRYEINGPANIELRILADKAQAALASIADEGFLSQEAVRVAGLTADECDQAIKLEWQRKREGLIWPGQPPHARKKALEEAAGNLTIPRRVAIWTAIRDLLRGPDAVTGHLQLGIRISPDGPARVILWHGIQKIRESVAALPMCLLDATMPVDIVRQYLPRLAVLAEVRAAAPYMKAEQITGGWGKTSLVPSDRATEQEQIRRNGLIGELKDFIQANSGGNGLVVTYQAIEDRFAKLPGIRCGHFNAMAGLDTFGDVASLFVIGRPLPDAKELRLMGIALTGQPIAEEAPQVHSKGALMADGSGAAISVRAYENPVLEAVRVAITDAEVVQAIGRARAVNRTADNPLNVFVLADVVLPLPVNKLTRWIDARLDPIGRMAARKMVFTSPADAHRAFPDLFPTPDAARMALKRAGGGGGDLANNALCYNSHRALFGKSAYLVTYRPNGRGQQTRTALVAGESLSGFRDWLEGLIGSLVVYEVADIPPSPQAAKPAPKPPQPPPPGEPPPLAIKLVFTRPFFTDASDPGGQPQPWHVSPPHSDWQRVPVPH